MERSDRTLSPRKIQLKVRSRFANGKLRAAVAVVGEPDIAQGASVELELFHYHLGETVFRRRIRGLLPGFSREVTFPIGPLVSGNSWFRASLTDRHGRTLDADVIQDKARPAPWWLGSRKGTSRKVPEPFTPLETTASRQRASVECWGRRYDFGGPSFVQAIHSGGAALLSDPMGLKARVNGRGVTWRGGPIKTIAQDKGIAVFRRTLTGGGLSVDLSMEVEIDGMVRLDWAVSSKRTVRVDELTLEIPIPARIARYLYRFPGQWGSARNAGALPADGIAAPFLPFVWLGNEDCGLAWFCESRENWFSADPDRAIEIVPDGDRVLLRLHPVATPVTLLPAGQTDSQTMTGLGTEKNLRAIEGLRYTMGLQATPVKPVVRDGWDYRTVVLGIDCMEGQDNISLEYDPARIDKYVGAGIRAVIIFEQWTDFEGHAIPADRAKLRALIKACHDRGLEVLLYFGFLISDISPEWNDYGHECVVVPKAGYPVFHYKPQPDQSAWKVCLRSVWQDMVVAGVARVMDEFDVDGVYLDGTVVPMACGNTLHGCGAAGPDGSIAPTWPIFAVRNAMRRIYDVVQSRKPGGQVLAHNSTCMTIPTIAWATSTWDGEQFQTMTKASELTDQLSLDTFRAEFMGHQWGVPAEFLCYSNAIPFRNAWAITLLHDVPIRPVKFDAEVPLASRLWQVMDEFGRNKAEWLPYWRNAEYVKTPSKSVKVSLYHHPDNGVLAVVSNLSSAKVSVDVRFDLARLGLSDGPPIVRDAMTDLTLRATKGKITCRLGALDWKLVRIELKH